MSEITIREAAISDCGRICDLNRVCLGYDYPQYKTMERLKSIFKRPTDKVFVTEYMGEVAGYVH